MPLTCLAGLWYQNCSCAQIKQSAVINEHPVSEVVSSSVLQNIDLGHIADKRNQFTHLVKNIVLFHLSTQANPGKV